VGPNRNRQLPTTVIVSLIDNNADEFEVPGICGNHLTYAAANYLGWRGTRVPSSQFS
jgi:hypothetical protein